MPAADTKPVPFRDVQPGQEFYLQRTLMMRLEDGVTLRGAPINAVALSSFNKGRLVHIEDERWVHIEEKVVPFRRSSL